MIKFLVSFNSMLPSGYVINAFDFEDDTHIIIEGVSHDIGKKVYATFDNEEDAILYQKYVTDKYLKEYKKIKEREEILLEKMSGDQIYKNYIRKLKMEKIKK